MNSEPHSHFKRWRMAILSRWTIVILLLLNLGGFLYLSNRAEPQASTPRVTPQTASLQQMAQAIEAGQVKLLAIKGDFLIATQGDKTVLTARKEAGVSAIQTLQSMGIPAETLASLLVNRKSLSKGSMSTIFCPKLGP